ncbi:MAG: transglycosylase SLT domain-containing protein [Bacteroidaceae bacterium]|nr:transglycosylase SLT domain-containing protein [Bacteroidaceae bacterium]
MNNINFKKSISKFLHTHFINNLRVWIGWIVAILLVCLIVLYFILFADNKTTMHDPLNHIISDNHPIDLLDIKENGELIIYTLYGPTSYFLFHGEEYGYQYRIAEDFASSIGVSARVEVLHNEQELVERFLRGEGDVVAYNLTMADSLYKRLIYCGEEPITHFIDSINNTTSSKSVTNQTTTDSLPKSHYAWAVRYEAPELAHTLNEYFINNAHRFKTITSTNSHRKSKHNDTSSSKFIRASIHPRTSVMDATKGILSPYDDIIKKQSHICNWDWRLLAALVYQESGFDPHAVSRAGALGLAQLLPSTASRYGISSNQLFDPKTNISGAVKYLSFLSIHFADVENRDQRLNFVLAAYNAGFHHIDDARRLAEYRGKNPNMWDSNVDSAVLWLMVDSNYKKPFIDYGYMRGTETFHYVKSIRKLWNYYKGITK